jgi:sugar lactone lactonase YvrE
MKYRLLNTIGGKGEGREQFARTLRDVAIDRAGLVYCVGDTQIKVFDLEGRLRRSWQTSKPAYCITVASDGTVYAGQAGQIEIFDRSAKLVATWRDEERLKIVTAIALTDEDVLVGDARHRCIRRFAKSGEFKNNIGDNTRRKGFIIPNGYLVFAVDSKNVIHAAHPGKHRVERYSLDGELLGRFGRFDGRDPEGFAGCCNPTNLTLASDDTVIVTEKAEPRVKTYDEQGKLISVIADEGFDPNCKNMGVAVDARGRIYVVDTVRLHVRVFAAQVASNKTEPARSTPTGASRS